MEYNSEIARNNLKFLRKSYGLTQAELSKNLDFAQNGISQYETGARPLGYEVAGMFANYFEVPFELFGNKNLSEIMIINSSIDVKDVLEVVDIIFPVFDSNNAKEDKYFKRGFDALSTIIKKAKAEIITGEIGKKWNREVVENNKEATKEKIDNCVNDFVNSYNSFHTLESIANLVGVMILVYAPLFDKEITSINGVARSSDLVDRSCLIALSRFEKSEIKTEQSVMAKKREGFMQMIKDAEKGDFDLICTREVSRFARNTVDSLQYTRQLREWGVEVFFYNDGIWSLEQDGELRLTIMSAMAQEESKHISERVRAGQRISREKGVLYGNGNILGYRLIKGKKSIDNTYEIIEEEAETVRMIYDLYLTGMGAKTIAGKMVEMKRKKADGTYNWEHLSVLRILNNKTYAGYISYNKSYTKNFLGHKRVTVRDVSQYEYVKGNFPAIVSEETWNRVQAIKSKKVVIVDGRKCSKPISKDKWCRHLVCECGSVYGKYKWRTNKNGEVSNGYQCRHQIRYRKRSFHEKQGLDGTGYCNVPSICEWKLDFMAKSILERLWKDQKSSVEELLQDIQDNYSEETGITDREYQIEKLKRESERLKNRMSNLVDMKLDDLIGSEEFEDKKCTIDERMLQIKNELAILSQDEEDNEPVEVEGEIKKIKEYLNGVCDLNQKQLSDELVDAVIARITPMENGAFKWYIQGEEYDTETSFDESKYVLYDRFTLNFEEAKKYRKAFGNFIRAVQWKDLIVEVYIRQD